jgi:hypothetical protein
MVTPNDGSRLSRLTLDRFAAGELPRPDRLSPEAEAHLAAVAGVVAGPLDVVMLRRRAAEGVEAPPLPRPANRWRAAVAGLALAAAALFVLRPAAPEIAARGGADLLVYEVGPSSLRAYDGAAVEPGADLVLKVRPDGRATVAVFGVDAEGAVSQYWPESGEDPEVLASRDGLVDLPGSLQLDDTPGAEVLVAVFDTPVGAVRDALEHAFSSGGLPAVRAWARAHPDADAVVVQRAAP